MSLLSEIGLHSSEYAKWKITISTTILGLKPNLRKEDEDAPVVQAAEPAAPRPRGLQLPRSRFPILNLGLRWQCRNQYLLHPSEALTPRLQIHQSRQCTGVFKNGEECGQDLQIRCLRCRFPAPPNQSCIITGWPPGV